MYESQLSQKTPDHFVSIPCILQVCRYYAGIKSPKSWQVEPVMLTWKSLPGQKFVRKKWISTQWKIGIIMKMEPRRESSVFQQKETLSFFRLWKTSSFRLFAIFDIICCTCVQTNHNLTYCRLWYLIGMCSSSSTVLSILLSARDTIWLCKKVKTEA